MRFKISATIPEDLASLTLDDVSPEIARATRKVEDARAELARVKSLCLSLSAAVEEARHNIARGVARPSDLQAALDQQRTAAVSVAGFEARVSEAEQALDATRERARHRFHDEALKRHRILAEAAAECAPLLERLRNAEADLDAMIKKETEWTNAQGMTQYLDPTPALSWPQCLSDSASLAVLRNRESMRRPASAPVAAAPEVVAARTSESVRDQYRQTGELRTSPQLPQRAEVTPDPPKPQTEIAAVPVTGPTTQTRRMQMPTLELRAAVGEVHTDRTVELTFSTGADVIRIDPMGTRYIERLSMDPKHINLDRLNAGAPLLNSHQADSLANIIGVVLDGTAKTDGRIGTARARFSKREDVEPIYQDVKDKIIKNVSVGYRVHRFEESREAGRDLPVRVATDWEPYEISIVPMGADAGARVRGTNPCEIVTHTEAA